VNRKAFRELMVEHGLDLPEEVVWGIRLSRNNQDVVNHRGYVAMAMAYSYPTMKSIEVTDAVSTPEEIDASLARLLTEIAGEVTRGEEAPAPRPPPAVGEGAERELH
jgi:hypothetical protein